MGVFDKASLALVPDGIKDGKLYSIKPTDGSGDFTFKRCDGAANCDLAATRVDENGLIEKGRENFVGFSNNFSTGKTPFNVTVSSGEAGYDGTNNAWKLIKGSSSGDYLRWIKSGGLGNVVFTYSIYVKAGSLSYFVIWTTGGNQAYFELTGNGSVTYTQGSNLVDSKIESVGNGWYRCSLTTYPEASEVRFYPTTDGTPGVAGGTSGDFVYIQNFQAEYGLVATEYIDKVDYVTGGLAGILEDLPRIDYTGGTPSLLMEPSRTNLVKYSEYFETTSWWFSTSADVELSDNTSPEGVKNAFKVTYGAGGNRLGGANFGLPNTPHTNSIYMRKVSGSGVVNFANQLGDTNNITLTTDWERYDVTATLVDGTARFYIYLKTFGDVIEVYGAQQEEGSYPTSYIPTYGTSVTRNDDSASQNSSYTFGSGAFSLFFEHEPIPTGSGGQVMILRVNPLDFYFRWTSDTLLNIWNQDAQQAILNTSIGRNANHKICMVYDGAGTTEVYVDGVKKTNGYSYTWPDGPYKILLNTTAIVSGDIPVHISQVMTFETALTNAECITLTTL